MARNISFIRSTVAEDGFDRLHENEDVTFEVEDRGLSPRGPRRKLVTPVADPLGVAPEPTTRI
jgi:cold shock CspA family protein